MCCVVCVQVRARARTCVHRYILTYVRPHRLNPTRQPTFSPHQTKTNQDRVRLAYRQSLAYLYRFPEVWHEFAGYEAETDDAEAAAGRWVWVELFLDGGRPYRGPRITMLDPPTNTQQPQNPTTTALYARGVAAVPDCLLLHLAYAEHEESRGQAEHGVGILRAFLEREPSTLGGWVGG